MRQVNRSDVLIAFGLARADRGGDPPEVPIIRRVLMNRGSVPVATIVFWAALLFVLVYGLYRSYH